MNTKWFPSRRSFFVGALGVTVLLGAPSLTQADQGKWWTPKEGGPRRDIERRRVERRVDRGWHRGQVRRHDRWRGGPFVRDYVVIRHGHRGPYFRARRFFVRPAFHRQVVYVRPVRFFVAADACIGGAGVSARFHDHDLYGCNFCDARFSDYGAYAAHVHGCDHVPGGYRVAVQDWDGDDEAWDRRGDREEFPDDDDWDD